MTMATETELKLSVTPEALAEIIADPAFFGAEATSHHQVSTYFDTPSRALDAAGLSLRVRAIDGRRVQTVKAEGATVASLFSRAEWERDITGDGPELDDINAALANAPGKVRLGDIGPIFRTEITRVTRVHARAGSRIELVADSGRVVAGTAQTAISEIELELLEGDRHTLFDLARALSGRVPLRLGVRSKSERGHALLRGKAGKAVKSEPLRLDAGMDAAHLFETVAAGCLRHFRLNEDILLATGAVEPVHQARVALRRLRSALTIFRDMLAGPDLDRLRGELHWLSALLGDVRNIDVLLPRIDAAAALGPLKEARDRALVTVVGALESERGRALMLDLAQWIALGAWRKDADGAALRARLARIYAQDRLDRLRRRLKQRGRHLARLGEAERHDVRILGKRLRYATEFFADLFPGRKAARRRARLLAELERIQTTLGDLNDLASARLLLASLGIAHGEALLAGGMSKPQKVLLAEAEKAYDALIDEKRFWR